jgi:lipoprotein NlpI
MTLDAWDIVRSGDCAAGLQLMLAEYRTEPDASSITELGIGYLWLRQYHAAWKHFHEGMSVYPYTMDVFYEMAGVAKWCSDEQDEAITEWQAGLKSEYTDFAGGALCPLLLFFASAIRQDVVMRQHAKALLTALAAKPRITSWPGPIVRFILGHVDKEGLRQLCISDRPNATDLNLWLANFYIGIYALTQDDAPLFEECMRRTADESRPEWEDKRFFLGAIWNGEFFLARHFVENLI